MSFRIPTPQLRTVFSNGLIVFVAIAGCRAVQHQTCDQSCATPDIDCTTGCNSFETEYSTATSPDVVIPEPLPKGPEGKKPPPAFPGPPIQAKPKWWAQDTTGLVFRWKTDIDVRLTKWGQARVDGHGVMQLAKGAFLAEHVSDALLRKCQESNQLSIEAVIIPNKKTQRGPARIITFSSNANSRNFTLGHDGDRLILRLRTPKTGNNGTNPEVSICPLEAGKRHHVVITYKPGRLNGYLNGKLVVMRDDIRGGFKNWTKQHFLFGDEWDRNRNWSGGIERVAIFNRALEEKEVQQSYEQSRNEN